METQELRKYGFAHRNCQIISSVVEQLGELYPVSTNALVADLYEVIVKLQQIRDFETDYLTRFESDNE
jgi:hypothetical protein